MALKVNNLFASLPAGVSGESFLTLFESSGATIEGIVSHSHSSPAGFWYDQPEDEWLVVLRGSAAVEFADGAIAELRPGDYLTIPRHKKHRVARTSEATVWLAVHIKG